jgi:hypothetical protein
VTTHEPGERELSPEERSLVEWIDTSFRPVPGDTGSAAGLVQRIERRIERRRRVRLVALPAGALAAGVLAALLWTSPSSTPGGDGAERTLLQAFADPPAVADEMAELHDYLPDDYRALASLMLEDDELP